MDMQPNWQQEVLEFKFATNTSITVDRGKGFPQTLLASGHPLTIDGFTSGGFEINDSGCPGIPYGVTWVRGSEISGNQASGIDARQKGATASIIYSVPVVNGTATPDVRRGSDQRVTLTTDTNIAAPVLPQMAPNTTIRWTLFLDQDTIGGHTYTILFAPKLIPLEGLLPSTRASMEFVTDATGSTVMVSLPIINIPIEKQ
jgi:hypothetical protein